eukprot:gene13119-biopygen6452
MERNRYLETQEIEVRYLEAEDRYVQSVSSGSVSKGTKVRIASGLEAWRKFLRDHVGNDENVFMHGLTVVAQERRIVMYMGTMYSLLGYRTERISRMISLVRSSFNLAGEDVSAFDGVMVKQARRSGRRSSVEVRVQAVASQLIEKYPFTVEMVLAGRVLFWQTEVWTLAGMDAKAKWLGIALCFDSGMRVSNLTTAEKNGEDHCIRANQLVFSACIRGSTLIHIRGG